MRSRLLFFVILSSLHVTSHATNFDVCLESVRNGTFGTGKIGATDSSGNILEDVSQAAGVTYGLCVKACGSGQEPFRLLKFSQQFSSWLLPWLALVSQLPFGPTGRLENLESVVLTVGSPMLAAYSLALTVLNRRWIARRFSKHNYPNTQNAIRVLSSLQQAPLRVTNEGALLASLIVLPQNDMWWRELIEWLAYPHTWSISAVTSIAWVVIAYIFTVIDSFTGDLAEAINANGQGVGSLWLWLLPIVIGWLQISPKCDEDRVRSAVERANKIAYAATDTHPVSVKDLNTEHRAIHLAFGEEDEIHDVLRRDERVTAPIYNYARFLPWVQAVEKVSETFGVVSERYYHHESVDPMIGWITMCDRIGGHWSKPHDRNRVGSVEQVARYCQFDPRYRHTAFKSRWGPNVFSRIAIASALAFMLQWGTVGAAFIVVYFTPTTGLGCRSASYLLFGALSTIVWLLLISSFLVHYVSTSSPSSAYTRIRPLNLRQYQGGRSYPLRLSIARHLAIFLRRLAKLLATVNAIWILAACLFQFGNFFDRCYCNSSVFGRGSGAYNIIDWTTLNKAPMKNAWVGGVCLAGGTAFLFVGFVNVFIDPPLPGN
ncbi:hypothetical protein EST38_g12071 [Candolleomyces aberdarensis]|uniref:Uncharacterized protein n=1 Tax=Candolleomyces aberdarensis TaxID=2316362 RepID=A0A4Q2D5K2_9AGAR|nr:hypothetical protein EST38_g12071 [Candolleomyces aberdarensis]